MDLMPGERILMSADEALVLSTHRVRSKHRSFGSSEITSIMLEQVASAQIHFASKPILLAIAVVVFLIGAVGAGDQLSGLGFFVALVLVAAYFITRRQVLSIASSAAVIDVGLSGMSMETAIDFVNTLESAKRDRIEDAQRRSLEVLTEMKTLLWDKIERDAVCAYCAEPIFDEAEKCPHCGSIFEVVPDSGDAVVRT